MIEDVRGVIIGQHLLQGRLFYDGRPQGAPILAETEVDLRQMAQRLALLSVC